jgi:hypothetical protein
MIAVRTAWFEEAGGPPPGNKRAPGLCSSWLARESGSGPGVAARSRMLAAGAQSAAARCCVFGVQFRPVWGAAPP